MPTSDKSFGECQRKKLAGEGERHVSSGGSAVVVVWKLNLRTEGACDRSVGDV